MKRFKILLSLMGWILFRSCYLACAYQPDLTRYEVALNQMVVWEAEFHELNSRGEQAAGHVYMARPRPGARERFGYLKLNYHPPRHMEVLADGKHLMLREQYGDEANGCTIESTPVAFLLRASISFKQGMVIQKVERQQHVTAITLCQQANPDAGSLTLVFDEHPVRLKRWIVSDPQGVQTQVTLRDVKIGSTLPPHVFRWKQVRAKR